MIKQNNVATAEIFYSKYLLRIARQVVLFGPSEVYFTCDVKRLSVLFYVFVLLVLSVLYRNDFSLLTFVSILCTLQCVLNSSSCISPSLSAIVIVCARDHIH